ncbi:MAG: C2 domain-containing protein [Monoraphidium minutum]|nr:MAG: C2 domain-containing protein [Monoraphidium minutum]
MVFGPLIGAGFGAAAGVALGAAVFQGDRPKDFKFITEAADRDDNIRTPASANINDEMRKIIPLTPEWTFWPDYDRWVMINRVVRLMWPKLTGAILDEVVKGLKPVLQGVLADLPLPPGIIEDITLGGTSLLDAEHLDPHFLDKYFTLGDTPVRVAGMKVYTTHEDNCTMEMPIMWGSAMAVDLQVYLKLGPIRVVVPVLVSDVQFKILTRITLALVDTIPCIGGATVTLLDVPHVDFKLRVLGGFDMMSLPGIKDAVRAAISYVVKEVMLYPNSVSVPLMTNFGAPKDPVGMLHIKLSRIEGLKTSDVVGKGDAYVVFSIREGRNHSSRVIKNCRDPVFDEEFYMVVDDLETQTLNIKVWDSDFGPQDDLLGVMQLYFTDEEIETDPETGSQKVVFKPKSWVAKPLAAEPMALPITAPPGPALAKLGILGSAVGAAVDVAAGAAGTVGGLVGLGGSEEVEKPLTATIKVAKTFAEVRAADEAAAGATAIAPRGTHYDEEGGLWEELTEAGARTVAIKQLAKEAAEEEAKRLAKLPKKERAKEIEEKAKRQKELDDKIVLTEEEVVLRGNKTPAEKELERALAKSGGKVKPKGMLFFSVSYMPFNKPDYDDDIEMKPAKAGLAAFVPFDPPRAREIAANVSDFQKGLLTVSIIAGKSLMAATSMVGSTNPYVELLLNDCDKLRCDERKVSRTIYNDQSPRWADKFDFVMISAGSMLTVNVWDKTSAVEMAASIKLSKSRFQDRLIGRVVIPVADVVRNGHLKDSFALQDAESGTIEMKLEWQDCYVDDYVD